MKIAVTYENGMVFQHFGKCANFLVVEEEQGAIKNRKILPSGDQGHGALVQVLKQAQVTHLICGGCGQGARNALQQAGITLISGAKGNAEVAVDAFLAGKLQDDPSGVCDHHDHEGHHDCAVHDHCE